MNIPNKETKITQPSNHSTKSQVNYKSIFVIWLFIFFGFVIIIWFGSAFMRKINESDSRAAYIQGKQLYEQGKKQEAFQKFLIAIENDTTNYQAYFYLSKLSWENQQPEQTLLYLYQFQHLRSGYIVPEDIAREVDSVCQKVAQYYIEKRNWQHARLAYDIAGNITFDISGYLKNLEKQFAESGIKSVRDSIWPDGIAVTLEDFENTTVPVLKRWVTNPSATIDSNSIVHNPVHRGNNAELLKIRYTSSGPDYWAKNVYIALQKPLALRAYVMGKQNTRCQLVANMRFAKSRPEQKVGPTGACFSNGIFFTEPKWMPLVIPDIYKEAMKIAKDPSGLYNPQTIQLEMVAINTFGNDCDLYLDDIEVFLPQ